MANSWSGIRKRLEQDLLCEKLRGRVQYFLTHYHGAPDQYGRFAVRLDGKEIVFANPYHEREVSLRAEKIKQKLRESRSWWELQEDDMERYREIERLTDQCCTENNTMEIYHITDALQIYLHAPIRESIFSCNAAVRMFAILDRRIGKRTLIRLKDARQPAWLTPLYQARFAVDGII